MTYITRSADHHYTFDGVTYPGVTSILKVMDKSDVLMAWASRMTAEAALDLLPQLESILATAGRDGTVRALTARSGWKRDESAALGTEIHGYADMLHRGLVLPPDLSDGVRMKVERYREWWQRSGWTPRATEALLVNTAAGYGGTLDILAYDADQRTVLADLKTGKGIYRETILQLAMYGASEWLDQDDGRLYPMPKADRYVVLHVTHEGVREVEVSVGAPERSAFLACLELYRWREATRGRL